MTPQVKQEQDFAAEQLEAEVREAEAQLELLRAGAEARKAKEDMDKISGLTAAKERVKKEIADFKQFAATDYAATKRDLEEAVKALKAGIQRLSANFTAWDEAAVRRFNARLDEADAKLTIWEARADQKRAERKMKGHDALATLKEKIELGRAAAAAARHEKYGAKAQAALVDAAFHFDQAYEVSAKRYEK